MYFFAAPFGALFNSGRTNGFDWRLELSKHPPAGKHFFETTVEKFKLV